MLFFCKSTLTPTGDRTVTFCMLKIANGDNGCSNSSNACANANGANGCINELKISNEWLTDG